jgi:hypothetical protein
MKKYTIRKARRILGKSANGISDEQIQKDIDVAIILKEMFFDMQMRAKKKSSQTAPNVP